MPATINHANSKLGPNDRFLGRVSVYLYTYDSNNQVNLMPDEKDEFVVNFSMSGTHLRTPIKESAQIKPFPEGEPIMFTYPLPIDGSQTVLSFSAFGVMNGKLVWTKEQPITLTEPHIFIIVDKNGLRLISKEADIPESDSIAEQLLSAGKKQAIAGILTAVEYGKLGPAIWVEESTGHKQRVRLRDEQEADPFDNEGRKKVKVLMDETGYAESIVVEL
jgi:hypothetical protein